MDSRRVVAATMLAVLSISCSMVQSPLSDVPISEPSVLQIIAVADRDMDASNYAYSTLRVNLYDKHGEYVTLKEGNVTVNGQPMTNGMFGEYVRTREMVAPNSEYLFTVTLSGGSQHSCRVRTPADLYKFGVPPAYDRRSPLTLTWENADPSSEGTLRVFGDTLSTQFTVNAGSGKITLQASALAAFHAGQRLRVTLGFLRRGTIEGGFMSTSGVSSTFSVVRFMAI